MGIRTREKPNPETVSEIVTLADASRLDAVRETYRGLATIEPQQDGDDTIVTITAGDRLMINSVLQRLGLPIEEEPTVLPDRITFDPEVIGGYPKGWPISELFDTIGTGGV